MCSTKGGLTLSPLPPGLDMDGFWGRLVWSDFEPKSWFLGLPTCQPKDQWLGKGLLHGSGRIRMMSRWPHHSKAVLGTKQRQGDQSCYPQRRAPPPPPAGDSWGWSLQQHKAGSTWCRLARPHSLPLAWPQGDAQIWDLHVKPAYLQLPGGHLEGQLGDAAHGPAGSIGGMQLVPDGITVHLKARTSVRQGQGTGGGDLSHRTHTLCQPPCAVPGAEVSCRLKGRASWSRTTSHKKWGKLPSSSLVLLAGMAAPVPALSPSPQQSSTQSISPCTQGLEGVTEKTLVTFFILFYLTKHLGLIRITSRAEPEPENSSLF